MGLAACSSAAVRTTVIRNGASQKARRERRISLSQHLQAQPLGALGQVRQVVLCPAGAKIRVHGRLGDSVVADRSRWYAVSDGDRRRR